MDTQRKVVCSIGAGAGFAGDRIDPAVALAASGQVDTVVLECQDPHARDGSHQKETLGATCASACAVKYARGLNCLPVTLLTAAPWIFPSSEL